MDYQTIKTRVQIALTSYTTHNKNKIPLDLWLEIQEEKRGSSTVAKRYNELIKRQQ